MHRIGEALTINGTDLDAIPFKNSLRSRYNDVSDVVTIKLSVQPYGQRFVGSWGCPQKADDKFVAIPTERSAECHSQILGP